MTISEIQARKRITLSFEVFPPKTDTSLSATIDVARQLDSLGPDFISVTWGAGGTTAGRTVEISQRIAALGRPALAHLTCVGSTPETVASTMTSLKAAGVENVLALRGDFPADATSRELHPSLRHASDLCAILKKEGFCVGAACYPEGHPECANRDEDIDNMVVKAEAGADFLVTQMFFDNNMLYSYLYRLQKRGVRLPVHAGIMPIVNAKQVARMVRLSNAYVPAKLLSFCDKFADNPSAMRQAGIAYATDQIIDLISNGVGGIHLYTMNKPEVTRDIIRNVDAIIGAVNAS
ncbi:MAG: methylenetetrahydrofolate reductase [Kiritimatiellae bacterium]|nr:methylenetetrahydrofolate reductase [Kiritimatiellia bacterium]